MPKNACSKRTVKTPWLVIITTFLSQYIYIYMYICNLFSMCANSHWNSTYIYMYEVNRMLKFIYVCYYLFPSPKHELTWELCKICFTALQYAYKPIILQIQCSRLCPIFDHANIMNRSYSFRINPQYGRIKYISTYWIISLLEKIVPLYCYIN